MSIRFPRIVGQTRQRAMFPARQPTDRIAHAETDAHPHLPLLLLPHAGDDRRARLRD